MDSLGLIAEFRNDVDDNALPQLWSDATIALYADDAQKMFCRLTNGLADSTSQMCNIDIDEGEPWAALDKRILKIRRAERVSDGRPVTIINAEDLDTLGVRLDRVGVVNSLVLGLEENKIRWGCVPSDADAITMTVFRLPLRPITTEKSQLEIGEQHHLHLLLWMKHLAYGKQDADVYDPRKASVNEGAFRAYCTAVKSEQDRARHKTRIVAYGGIGGFGAGPGNYGNRNGGW